MPALAAQTAASWCTGSASASVSLVITSVRSSLFVLSGLLEERVGVQLASFNITQIRLDLKKEMFHALYALGNSN